MSMIFPIQNGTDIVTADDINRRPMAPVKNQKLWNDLTDNLTGNINEVQVAILVSSFFDFAVQTTKTGHKLCIFLFSISRKIQKFTAI